MSREQLVEMARRAIHAGATGEIDLEPGVHRVPATNYTDPQRFQLEVDRIFKRLPLMLGFSSELRKPGSYRAMEVAGVPVVLLRGADGAIRAFVNMCSHRGAQVFPEGTGEGKRFACPYHAWTYDTQGDLVGVLDGNLFGDIDRSCLGLTPLPVAERAGLIWAILSPKATIDIDAFLCGYDEMLAYLDFEHCHVVGRQAIAGPNWKVAYDGYLDFYHLPILHRDSFGPNMSSKALYNAWGPHQRVMSPDRHSEAMLTKPESEWDERDLISGVWTIFPHISIAAFDAGGKVYMVSQLMPGATVGESVTVQHFLHTQEPTEEILELSRQRMAFLHHVVADEDYATGLGIQKAVATGAKSEFLFGRNEGGGQRFHQWVDALLATDDADLAELFAKGIEARA